MAGIHVDTRAFVRLQISRAFQLVRTARHPSMKAQINASLLDLLDVEDRLGRHPPEEVPRHLEPRFEVDVRTVSKRLDELDAQLERGGPDAVWAPRRRGAAASAPGPALRTPR